jgi:hypothetical protein
VPHLEPDLNDCGPLNVVGLGEGRPPAIPDDGRDPVVTLVPVWGEGAAPPVRGALSVAPALPSVLGHLSLQLSNPLPQPLGLQRADVWSAAAAGRTSAWSAAAGHASHKSTTAGRASAWSATAVCASHRSTAAWRTSAWDAAAKQGQPVLLLLAGGYCEAVEGREQEMFRLHDSTALIPDVSS